MGQHYKGTMSVRALPQVSIYPDMTLDVAGNKISTKIKHQYQRLSSQQPYNSFDPYKTETFRNVNIEAIWGCLSMPWFIHSLFLASEALICFTVDFY